MMIIARITSSLAGLATLYIAKMLVVDIFYADFRRNHKLLPMVVSIAVGGAFVAGPAWLELWLMGSSRPQWAIVAAILAIMASAGAFTVLATAFTP